MTTMDSASAMLVTETSAGAVQIRRLPRKTTQALMDTREGLHNTRPSVSRACKKFCANGCERNLGAAMVGIDAPESVKASGTTWALPAGCSLS